MTPAHAPFAFPGEASVNGTPIGSRVRDLNLMVRRGAFIARVEHHDGQCEIRIDAPTIIVATASLTIGFGNDTVPLGPLDALVIERIGTVDWHGAGYCYTITPARSVAAAVTAEYGVLPQ